MSTVAKTEFTTIVRAARAAYAIGDLEAAHNSRLDLAELTLASGDPLVRQRANIEFERLGGDTLTSLHMLGGLYLAAEKALAARIAGDQRALEDCLKHISQFQLGQSLEAEPDPVDAICSTMARRVIEIFDVPRSSAGVVVPFQGP